MTAFDPYREWLDIGSGGPPVDHYQLLGLDQFESSSAKIENAVASRADLLQALSMGQHVHDAQRILSEVARARICLLDSDRKAEYDAELRRQHAAPMPMPTPLEEELDDTNALRELKLALESRATRKLSADGSSRSASAVNQKKRWLIAGGILLLLGGSVSAFWIVNEGLNVKSHSVVSHKKIVPGKLKSEDRTTKNLPPVSGHPNPKSLKDLPDQHDVDSEDDLPAPKNVTTSSKESSPKNFKGKSKGKSKSKSKSKARGKSKGKAGAKSGKKPLTATSTFSVRLPDSPLEFLPASVQLPNRDNVDKFVMFELLVSDQADLRVGLPFPALGAGKSVRYQIRANETSNWILSQESIKERSSVDIAKIFLEDYSLNFQWLSEAQSQPNAEGLRNAVLEISHGEDQVKFINLQESKLLGPLKLAAKGLSGRIRTRLDNVPNAKSLKFSLSQFFVKQTGFQASLEPGVGAAKKPLKMFFSEKNAEKFFWLEVQASIRDNTVSIDAELKVTLPNKSTVAVESAENFLKIIERFAQDGKRLKTGAASRKLSKSQNDEFLAQSKQLNHWISTCRRYQSELLPKLINRNIGVKLICQLDKHQIDIARTGGKRYSTHVFTKKIEEFKDYDLVYEIDLKGLAGKVKYDADLSTKIGAFDRIGYLIELKKGGRQAQTVFVSMEAFTKDINRIGIPFSQESVFQQGVKKMNVFSNDKSLKRGKNLEQGYIEFWPDTYKPQNDKKVAGASDALYDFGDKRTPGKSGYGSMQIHNLAAKQTIFALNNWGQGNKADLGIGNCSGENPDWTFAQNAQGYTVRRLRIYVRKQREMVN